MIEFVIDGDVPVNGMVSYKIFFGRKYYVGATANIIKRVSWHKRTINNAMANDYPGINSVNNIVNYIKKNKRIKTAKVVVIEWVDKEEELVQAEQTLLDIGFFDKKCLNFLYKAYRKVNGVEIRGTTFVGRCKPNLS